jgi:hypothetical protein
MALRFTIRSSDIKRLRKALDVDRCPEKDKRWTISLEVQPSIAEFRFHDKKLSYPIDGKSVGYAEFPEHVIWESTRWVLEKSQPKEVTVVVHGRAFCCHDRTTQHEIQIGYVRHPKWGWPVYTNEGELVVLGQMLEDPSLLHPDLPMHIKEATQSIAGDTYRAAATLRQTGVTHEDISKLVENKLADLRPSVRDKFNFLESTLWKS